MPNYSMEVPPEYYPGMHPSPIGFDPELTSDFFQAIGDIPQNVLNDVRGFFNAGNIGKGFQYFGGALQHYGGPAGDGLGSALKYLGDSMEAGHAVSTDGWPGLANFALESVTEGAALAIAGYVGLLGIAALSGTDLLGAYFLSGLFLGALNATLPGLALAAVFLALAAFDYFGSDWFALMADIELDIASTLLQALKDPLILDLDGDGVELVSLNQSTAHFDYGDGFAERSGWVSPDDGILAIDRNGNGTSDGAAELFGSANLHGFEVLEALDSNGDGKIDAEDAAFAQMRVWRDLDSDGAADDGELQTLTEAGIASIQLSRTDVPGTNQGHTVGFGATFTRLDGTTGDAQTIYFETDRRDTVPVEAPAYTLAEGVDDLPKLPSSGNIFPIAYVLSTDAAFRTAWTALADQADDLSIDVVNARILDLNASHISHHY